MSSEVVATTSAPPSGGKLTGRLIGAGSAEHCNIPEAIFIEDVEKLMKDEDWDAKEHVLPLLEEQLMKYQYMENNLRAKKVKLKAQIPDLKNNLKCIEELQKKASTMSDGDTSDVSFKLSESVFVDAVVPRTETVLLWLGANILLEYPLDEAKTLLTKNLAQAEENLIVLTEDLLFLRDQITTTEVNIARIYNWNVANKKSGNAAS